MAIRSQALLLLAHTAASSLASPVVGRDATASGTAIAPAATTVSSQSPAGVELFDAETVQLTEEVLRDVNSKENGTDLLSMVGFGDDPGAAAAALSRRDSACKAFPGDWNYPKQIVWSLFDLLLGGALIKTTPIAAPCYKSSGLYDEAKCADVSTRFTTADLQ